MSTPRSLESCSPEIRRILLDTLTGSPLTVEQGLTLFSAQGADLKGLCETADLLRRAHVGDEVSYVINRNINFTNVCIKTCRFCAYARGVRSEEGYFLNPPEILNRVSEAVAMGATEVCLQAGLAPLTSPDFYVTLCSTIKERFPDLHIHAFSPEEVKYGAGLCGVPIRHFLSELKRAGLGSLPGTSAEILDDSLRATIAPGRITTGEWVEVIRAAHQLEIPTTATMMFGHVESLSHRLHHMELLRNLQGETGGFTEFVPLSFVHQDSPLFVRNKVPGVQPGPSNDDITRLYGIARLMLGASFRNIQASWVKEGIQKSEELLSCGVNDLGGTLINESISTTAGAQNGQLATPATLRAIIRNAGRTPVQRTTTYQTIKSFPPTVTPSEAGRESQNEPLNHVCAPGEVFGSYSSLSQDRALRYEYPNQRAQLRNLHR